MSLIVILYIISYKYKHSLLEYTESTVFYYSSFFIVSGVFNSIPSMQIYCTFSLCWRIFLNMMGNMKTQDVVLPKYST